MNPLMPTPPAEAMSFLDPFGFGRAAFGYWRDAVERSVLYMDVMRQRGNQYLEHIEKTKPNVLGFDAEVVMDGRELPRPVNYELMRILPPEGTEIDLQARPFVVVDPRAGHGPGIGGFKPDSEVGVALRAGHPCSSSAFCPIPSRGRRWRMWSRPRSPSCAASWSAIRTPRRSPWWWATVRPAGRS